MLSELLSAAISGSSEMTVQGTAGTDESHLRYGWNYSALIAKGPHAEALTPAPILLAMQSRTKPVLPKDLAKNVDEAVLETLVTLFRDLRNGITNEGWAVEKPEAVMSTAEVVQVVAAVVRNHQHFPKDSAMDHVPGYLTLGPIWTLR